MSQPISNARKQAEQQQKLAADPRASVLVAANAGSGKTHVLINRVTRILLDGAAPEQILCVTFTKAAASEMLTRLFAHLGRFSILDDQQLRVELSKLDPELAQDKEDLAKARRLFARALETPGGLKIRTIHGFCETLLRQFPVEAGISPGFRVIEQTQAHDLQQKLVRQIGEQAVNNPKDDLAAAYEVLAELGSATAPNIFAMAAANARQLQHDLAGKDGISKALANTAKTLGVGLGDTKTKICTDAIDLFDHQVLERIAAGLATGAKINQQKAEQLKNALASTDPVEKVDQLLGVFLLTKFNRPDPDKFVSKAAQSAMPELPGLCIDMAEICETVIKQLWALSAFEISRAALVLANGFVKKYGRAKREAGWVDFDDLIEYSQALLTGTLSSDWVLYKLDGSLRHVLVDEAQDNSPAQWAVIGALTAEFFAGSGTSDETRTLFAVGDPKQSIYRFQGADPALFIEQKQALLERKNNGQARIYFPELSSSWRSTPQILTFVDACFSGLDQRETKFVGDEQAFAPTTDPGFSEYLEHGTIRQTAMGSVTMAAAILYEKQQPDTDPTNPVDAVSSSHPVSILAKNIARDIKSMLARGDQITESIDGNEVKRAITGGDILILVRKRGNLFREIIRHLKLQSVPVAGADRMVLQSETAVLDLLSLAKAALQPADNLSLAEVLTGPFVHPVQQQNSPIATDELFALAHGRDQGQNLYSALSTTKNEAFAEAKILMADMITRAGYETPYRFFSGLLYRVSETGEPMIQRLLARLGMEIGDAIQEFLGLALNFGQTGDGSLFSFVREMNNRQDEIKREMQQGGATVRVMTVHGAKGLEAPIVILPDTNSAPAGKASAKLVRDQNCWFWSATGNQLCPAVIKYQAKQQLLEGQEHRRLLYVALTRAKDHLMMYGHESGNKGIDADSWYKICESAFKHLVVAKQAVSTEDQEGHISYQLGTLPTPAGQTVTHDLAKSGSLPQWMDQPLIEDAVTIATTPSHFGAVIDDLDRVNSPIADDSSQRFRRGNLIHSLLQSLPELPIAARQSAVTGFLDQQSELTYEQKQEIADVTLTVLNHPDFAELFGPNSRAELPITGSLLHLGKKQIITGKIDRLVVNNAQVLVLDFKTNRPPPKTASKVPKNYLQQMATYRQLLQQVWPNRNIRCALLWTDGPNLMELPAALMDTCFD